MSELTEIQERCLKIIITFTQKNGKPPTRKELADLVGQKSTNGINQILSALNKKGYIKIDPPGKRRNIMVLRGNSKQLVLF
jgi:SOS-response transcriptional repressor LexA